MITLTRFEFQCPSCRVRLTIDEQQRGKTVDCPHCEQQFTAPCYHVGEPGWRPKSIRETMPRACPACGGPAPVSFPSHSRRECARCGHEFAGTEAHSARLPSMPVARTFSREDRRWSLQHLMLSADKRFVPDALLGARAKRRFRFYCGDCGSIQVARIWDIASQLPCSTCDSLVIIPAPNPGVAYESPQPRAVVRPYVTEAATGLFCPQCGASTPNADRSRHTRAYCRHCTLWF